MIATTMKTTVSPKMMAKPPIYCNRHPSARKFQYTRGEQQGLEKGGVDQAENRHKW